MISKGHEIIISVKYQYSNESENYPFQEISLRNPTSLTFGYNILIDVSQY